MRVLLDTNVLLRSVEPADRHYKLAVESVAALKLRTDEPCLFPQNCYEFWVVSTRPADRNGRGRTPEEAAAELAFLKSEFAILPDRPEVFPEWERLVTAHRVSGKPAHDARLVAAMLVHGVTHLLTFNDADFRRFDEVTVLNPAEVLASAG